MGDANLMWKWNCKRVLKSLCHHLWALASATISLKMYALILHSLHYQFINVSIFIGWLPNFQTHPYSGGFIHFIPWDISSNIPVSPIPVRDMPGHISGRPSSVVGVVGFLKGFLWLMGDVGSWEYLRHVGMYPCLLYIYICIYIILYI